MRSRGWPAPGRTEPSRPSASPSPPADSSGQTGLPRPVSAYRAAPACDPADPDVHLRLGALYQRLDAPANAGAAYATAADLRPKHTTVLVALGRSREKAGDLSGAVEAYRRASLLS